MNPSTPAVTPLRQRMIDDMRMRKLEHKTREGYLRAVRNLVAFLGRSPDTATVEDLRRFQLHLVDQGTSPITLNVTLTGLKFFFDVTLDRGELMAKMQPVRVPRLSGHRNPQRVTTTSWVGGANWIALKLRQPRPLAARRDGPVLQRPKLGGLLNFYKRATASS